MKTQTNNGVVILSLTQFQTKLAAGTLQQGVTYKIKGAPVDTIKIGTLAFAKDSDGIITLPVNANFGTGIVGSGLYLVKATDSEIEAKTQNYKPIVPSSLDKAVMEGLGDNSLTWSDAYKTSARNTIGASAAGIAYILEEDD